MSKWRVSVLLALLVSITVGLTSEAARAASPIDPALAAYLRAEPPDHLVGAIVVLRDQLNTLTIGGKVRAEWQRTVVLALQQKADSTQTRLRVLLEQRQREGKVQSFAPLWITNAIAVTASPDVILELAARTEVARIDLDRVVLAPNRTSRVFDDRPVEQNLIEIGAPSAWARGFTGKGVVVALLDTGVDMTNPDLAARWRGGSNSWFDPYGEHLDAPIDVDGHGTQMLGVIVGGDAGGSRIGVAPDAKWIAAKIFNDRGRATTAGIHKALRWLLDPDGDPATDDAPDVVSSSWSLSSAACTHEFDDDLRALRAVGILPVFAAGTTIPASPANTPGAFAVGALETADELYVDSPHGPSKCGETTGVYPHVVAPGVNIRTTDRFGFYTTVEGTSIAAAQVGGALALLLSANPKLSADEQQAIVTETSVDLGESGPDNRFGYGRIDITAALDRVLGSEPMHRATPSPPEKPITSDNTLALIALSGTIVAAAIGLRLALRRSR